MRSARVWLLSVAACASEGVSEVDAGAVLSPPDASGSTVDAAVGDPWERVARLLDDSVAASGIVGYQFVVHTAEAAAVFRRAGGAYALEQEIPLDSSIKPTTAIVVLSLVRDGLLRLDDTLGLHLGWTGPEAGVTIAQLMAFTSGFPGMSPCLTPPPQLRGGQLVVPSDRRTLAECAEEIRRGGLIAPPGAEFHYGANHQLLLALVAERVSGRPWSSLYEERVARAVGGAASAVRYTNNRVAASAVGTADGYAAILRALALDAGHLRAGPSSPVLLPRALTEAMFADDTRTHAVMLTATPWSAIGAQMHFGLGVWLDCTDFADPTTCVYFGSGGNGTTVWSDPQSGHVAALVLYQGTFTGYRVGHALMRRLLPLVRAGVTP